MTPADSKDLRERMQRVAAKPRPRLIPGDSEVMMDAEPGLVDEEDDDVPVRDVTAAAAARDGADSAPSRNRRTGRARRSAEGGDTSGHRAGASAQRENATPSAASRAGTLVEWAKWELTAVPVQRIRWMATLLRGR